MRQNIKSLCLFDLDHTLLTANSSFKFGAYLYKKKIFNLQIMCYMVGCYAFHKSGLLSLEGLHHTIFKRLFWQRFATDFTSPLAAFIKEELTPLFYAPAMQQLQAAQQSGHYVGILSSSPEFLVAAIAQHLGITVWKGTQYATDNEGRFNTITEVINGTAKAQHLASLARQYHIPQSSVIAYSDSYLDRPFLEAAGVAVGVNPDKKLRHLCLKNGWDII